MLVCVQTREISVDCVTFVQTYRLIIIVMNGLRDMWERVTLHRLSGIIGVFGNLGQMRRLQRSLLFLMV